MAGRGIVAFRTSLLPAGALASRERNELEPRSSPHPFRRAPLTPRGARAPGPCRALAGSWLAGAGGAPRGTRGGAARMRLAGSRACWAWRPRRRGGGSGGRLVSMQRAPQRPVTGPLLVVWPACRGSADEMMLARAPSCIGLRRRLTKHVFAGVLVTCSYSLHVQIMVPVHRFQCSFTALRLVAHKPHVLCPQLSRLLLESAIAQHNPGAAVPRTSRISGGRLPPSHTAVLHGSLMERGCST